MAQKRCRTTISPNATVFPPCVATAPHTQPKKHQPTRARIVNHCQSNADSAAMPTDTRVLRIAVAAGAERTVNFLSLKYCNFPPPSAV